MKWIRPIISIMFAVAVINGFFMGKIEPRLFLVIAAGAIGWWYYDRSKDKRKLL